MAGKSRQEDRDAEGVAEARRRIAKARRTEATELELSNLGLTELPPEIGQLTALTELYASYNQLTALPPEIGQLTALTGLYAFNNQLSALPPEIGQLTALTVLYLNDNQLTALPPEIGQLAALTNLYLNDNRLTALPPEIGQLTALTGLRVWNNQLSALPAEIGQLTALRELYVWNNQLSALPQEIGQLTALTDLRVWNNQLSALPAEIGQLTALTVLDVSNNQLTALPEIGRLTVLTELYLNDNQLTALPQEIGQLAALMGLNVSNNQLTALPQEIGQPTALTELYVSNNQLSALPQEIGQLTALTELDASNNQLTALPQETQQLHTLERLFLHGNGRLGIPPAVLGAKSEDVVRKRAKPAAPREILEYYFRLRAGKRPLNEAKLILVGRGGVGKTSLVKRLLSNRFDPNEARTEGICISEWPLHLRGTDDVRLNLWDFGGQEIMHATHQFFLTQRSIYVLVLEGRQGAEDADAEYWLRLIESFGTDSDGEVSPVLVVLNKIKASPFDLNRRALQQKYPFIHGFVATDCADGTGLNELRAALERETDRLKHLRDAFPASWFTIKDRLAGMKARLKRNFVTFDEYRALCAENGEQEPPAQDALATHLHNLGIALNYKDDPRLRDTHVLEPRWVTSGIYTLLNAPRVAKRKGELRLADAAGILDATEYPRQMHRFLFDLMKKFKLCFSFPDDDTHYLIPELLDKQQPEQAAEFKPAACLNFEYRYPVLPEGLLPRFIVRTHSLSAGLPRWRSGVVLAFEGNRALVKADVQDKCVFIAVGGPTAGRRRLLAVIRSDLERIHAEISKLGPEGFVPVPDHPGLAVPYEKLLAFDRRGMRTFPEAFGADVVELDVQALLNGVDLEGTHPRREPRDEMRSLKLFYSYSHRDEVLRDELETHLKILHRQGLIDQWHDRRIVPGDDWKTRIDENLERADIILLLVSADFIASDYCYEKEMKRALERHAAGEARVIPVVVRDVNWKGAPFAKLQALPKDAKAVTEWPSRDAAWRNVSEGIERVVGELRATRDPDARPRGGGWRADAPR